MSEALSSNLNTASGNDRHNVALQGPMTRTLESYYERYEGLRNISARKIRKAWFTMAHLIVPPGAHVVDMGCADGMMTYAMAILNPEINFIGVDINKATIAKAKKDFSAPNLAFHVGDITKGANLEKGSVDAIINSFIMHEIFSAQKYHEQPVVNMLEQHMHLLKPEGLMFVRDFAMPPPGEYVTLEMPDSESKGDSPQEMSEADLLIWYSQHARPYNDKSCYGFFLEELPPRFPGTRLFRLPYKWAYEFIMRKDERDIWESELPKEYTFFTPREHRKKLRSLGARVLYSTPHWDDSVIRERFQGRFRLYDESGHSLGTPPTSFVAVAQKIGEGQSLRLHERRPSHSDEFKIRVKAVRNEANGQATDIVRRELDVTEVLPYRQTETGQVNIFIHEGLPRGIANAVPRTGKDLDGKSWSGHMIEAIAVPTDVIANLNTDNHKETVLFARDYLGLKPAMGCVLEDGRPYYPAPDFIDEKIETRYLRVMESGGDIEPPQYLPELEGFTVKGRIREVSAQSILDAINVGLIPNARLEIQIQELFTKLEQKYESWDICPLTLDDITPDKLLDTTKFKQQLADYDTRFKDIKGTAGQIRNVKSIFIDEGWVQGGIQGLASRDVEFVIHDDQTVNKAVVLPMGRDAKSGDIYAGMVKEFLPIPQRHKGNGLTLRAPSFNLPKEVRSLDDAKKFIAEQFDTTPDKVARMGESYFCHIGVTPTRLFPFCVTGKCESSSPAGGPVEYAPMDEIWDIMWILWDWNFDQFFLSKMKNAYELMRTDNEMSAGFDRKMPSYYDQYIANAAPKIGRGEEVRASAAPVTKPAATTKSGSGGSVRSDKSEAEADSGFSYESDIGFYHPRHNSEADTSGKWVSSPDFTDIKHGVDKSIRVSAPANTTAAGPTQENTRKSKEKR